MDRFSFNLRKLKISKHRRSLAIEGIRFELNNDENSIAIIGESGMGKTTLYKSLFAKYISLWKTEKPFEFECKHFLGNEEINQDTITKNKIRTTIGFATQLPYFFESLTVRDNLFCPLKWKNIKWSKPQEDEYINMFQLDDLINKEMSILSGGQKQLINITRMLVLKPQVAIIDECFSNMDEKMSKRYIDILKAHFTDTYFLLTSHRKLDVKSFDCKTIKLKQMDSKSGETFVTCN